VTLESPHVAAQASEAGLDLVSDADATAGADHLKGALHVVLRKLCDSSDSLESFNKESCHLTRARVLQGIFELLQIFLAGLTWTIDCACARTVRLQLTIAAVGTAPDALVRIRIHHVMDSEPVC